MLINLELGENIFYCFEILLVDLFLSKRTLKNKK